MKTAKSLDCVEMKRAAQRMIRKQVKEMTPEEEIAFFRAGGKEFEKAIGEAKRLSGKKGPIAARQRAGESETETTGDAKRPVEQWGHFPCFVVLWNGLKKSQADWTVGTTAQRGGSPEAVRANRNWAAIAGWI